MPVPASDAIASDIGHGALGVRYGLRPFRDLLSETVGQRHLWIELRPKKVFATWTAAGGGVGGDEYWKKAVAETSDGVVLDVVGVKTLTETLVRVESTALLAAATGTFFYDGAWLWIHLTAHADPAGTTVIAELGIHVASHGVNQPILLPDRLANGTLEAWTGAVPDGWTHAEGAGVTLDKTTSDPLQGSYAARFTFTAAAGNADLYQSFTTLAAGTVYRLSGAYRATNPSIPVGLYVWDTAAAYLQADGRSIGGAVEVFTDAAGAGEWRRFAFDFLCPSWATVRVQLRADPSGAQTGTVDFDDVKLQPISRYAYHEPLLSVDSLPTIEAARADSFWGEQSAAIGSLSLANAGGRFEVLLAAYDWLGGEAIFRVGGRFQLGANEILMDDCPVIASAKLLTPVLTDARLTFDLEDDRTILIRTLPLRTYNNNGVDAYTQPDRGRVRPLLWGTKAGIRPVQYDVHYEGGGPIPLGKYELADCTDWITGMQDSPVITLHWYADETSAQNRDTNRRTTCTYSTGSESVVLGWNPFAGTIEIRKDGRPIIITQENNKLYFNTGGGTLTAVLTPGVYVLSDVAADGLTRIGLLADLQAAMRALDGADIVCDFTISTQKVRITKGAGTLNLLCATGSDVQSGIWSILGFDASADKTLALTYNADNVFTSAPESQILRIDAIGFKDDASGTYTGSAGATIEKACDIAHHILRVLLKVSLAAINVPSFVSARTGAKPCSLYIGASRTVGDIFSELETSGNFDLILNGGIWSCVPRDTSVPAGTPELVDADFLSFESYYDPEDLFGTVTLTYNEAPDGGDPIEAGSQWAIVSGRTQRGEVTDATVALRHGRPHRKSFKSCLRDAADAAFPLAGSRLEAIATQAQTKRRRFRFSTKGKALQAPVNGKIRLTRARGLDTTGALSQVLVRVLSKRDNWTRWVSDVEAIEVI